MIDRKKIMGLNTKTKALTGLILLLIIAGLSCIPASAEENVSAAFDGDIDVDDLTINSTCNQTTYQETFYLPMTLGQVHRDNTNISITAGTKDTDIELFINGNEVTSAPNYTLGSGSSYNANKDTWGVSNSSAYINVTLHVITNETAETAIWVNANDGTLSGDNFTYSISESLVTTPNIKNSDTVNTYTVEDKVKVSQDSSFNLTYSNATFTYPDMASSTDIKSLTGDSLNKTESSSKTLTYQKNGPFVTDIDTDKDGSDRTTEMKVYSYENLSAVFDENLLEDPWKDDFPSFDKDSLTIELDGTEVDFEDPEGQVTTDEMSLDKGYQTLTFNYSTAAAFAPTITVQEKPWHEFMNIPYFWPAVIAIGLIAIGVLVLATRRD